MTDFKVISTQEEFDAAISERLKREKEGSVKKTDYDELQKKLTELEKTRDELTSSLEGLTQKSTEYEKTVSDLTGENSKLKTASLKAKIAREVGLPYELADRLTGEDEKALKADAESLSGLISKPKATPPLKSTEPEEQGGDAAYRALLSTIEGD